MDLIRLEKLLRLLGSENDNEALIALKHLRELLKKNSKTWNHFVSDLRMISFGQLPPQILKTFQAMLQSYVRTAQPVKTQPRYYTRPSSESAPKQTAEQSQFRRGGFFGPDDFHKKPFSGQVDEEGYEYRFDSGWTGARTEDDWMTQREQIDKQHMVRKMREDQRRAQEAYAVDEMRLRKLAEEKEKRWTEQDQKVKQANEAKKTRWWKGATFTDMMFIIPVGTVPLSFVTVYLYW